MYMPTSMYMPTFRGFQYLLNVCFHGHPVDASLISIYNGLFVHLANHRERSKLDKQGSTANSTK